MKYVKKCVAICLSIAMVMCGTLPSLASGNDALKEITESKIVEQLKEDLGEERANKILNGSEDAETRMGELYEPEEDENRANESTEPKEEEKNIEVISETEEDASASETNDFKKISESTVSFDEKETKCDTW